MPSLDFILAGRHIGQFEEATCIGDGVIRMRHDEDLGVHPDVPGIAFQFHHTVARQIDRDHLILHGKRNVVRGSARHVHGVQNRIAALGIEVAAPRNEHDVRNVAAILLIQMLACFRKVHGLPFGDVLQKHDGIRDTTIGADFESLEVANLVRFGIANARVLSNGKFWSFGDGTGPFNRSGDGSSVVDLDHGVVGLRGSATGARDKKRCGGHESHAEKMLCSSHHASQLVERKSVDELFVELRLGSSRAPS